MKRLVAVVIPAILLVGLALLGISDTNISVAASSIPNEIASSVTNTGNSSGSATITITMYAVADE